MMKNAVGKGFLHDVKDFQYGGVNESGGCEVTTSFLCVESGLGIPRSQLRKVGATVTSLLTKRILQGMFTGKR